MSGSTSVANFMQLEYFPLSIRDFAVTGSFAPL
jgi:hypothetical protein